MYPRLLVSTGSFIRERWVSAWTFPGPCSVKHLWTTFTSVSAGGFRWTNVAVNKRPEQADCVLWPSLVHCNHMPTSHEYIMFNVRSTSSHLWCMQDWTSHLLLKTSHLLLFQVENTSFVTLTTRGHLICATDVTSTSHFFLARMRTSIICTLSRWSTSQTLHFLKRTSHMFYLEILDIYLFINAKTTSHLYQNVKRTSQKVLFTMRTSHEIKSVILNISYVICPFI